MPVSSVAPQPSVLKLAILALALGGFGIGTNEFVAMGLLPEIAGSLHITEPTAGHVISAYALGVVIGAPLIAALTARVPRKAILLALMAVFTLGNVATVFAPTYESLIVARFVAGLPHGAFFGIAALVAARMLGPGNRAKAVAQVMTGLTVATVIGVPVASWLGQAFGWRSAFVLVVVSATFKAAWEGANEPLDEGGWPLLAASAQPWTPVSTVPRTGSFTCVPNIRWRCIGSIWPSRRPGSTVFWARTSWGAA